MNEIQPQLSLFEIGKFSVESLDLVVYEGEILTLFGPSGSGKTTILRIIAGLEKPESGIVKFGDKIASNSHIFVEPEDRKVGMVFQDSSLFPHLTVSQNVIFGLRKDNAAIKRERLDSMLNMTKLMGLEDRFPHQLSGGEQQRVALARALATNPSIILFDEPFANLDEQLRRSLLIDVRSILKRRGITAVFVSHDPKDALSFSDRVAVLNKGKIEQVGSPEEVYTRPQNSFVANSLGHTNIVEVKTTEKGCKAFFGEICIDHEFEVGKTGMISLRPQWCLWNDEVYMSKAVVKNISYYGSCKEVTVKVHGCGNEVMIQTHSHKPIELNQEIGINFDIPELNIFQS